jgi:ABC-2 type transport system ATP-binding protein
MTVAIRIAALGKIFPRTLTSKKFEALSDVSLELSEGEVFGFIGPNGAGKSTTIKILTGVLRASSGRAEIFGCDVNLPLARRQMGYVPENPRLYDYLTPFEVLQMGLRLHQVIVSDERRHCLEWLERFGLADVANKVIRSFSKGMTQRVALAHAMVINPRLLILDEPLSGLDPVGRKDVVDLLADYRTKGGTIFMTSHVLNDVERLADRFGLIHKGKLLAVQSPNDLVGGEQFVTVRSLGASVIPGFSEESGGRWFSEIRREELWVVLEQLKAASHTLIEVKPTLSLESAFFRFLEPREVKK